jgi:hypothetical protein
MGTDLCCPEIVIQWRGRQGKENNFVPPSPEAKATKLWPQGLKM